MKKNIDNNCYFKLKSREYQSEDSNIEFKNFYEIISID